MFGNYSTLLKGFQNISLWIIIILTLGITLFLPATALCQPPSKEPIDTTWHEAKKKNGITVFLRNVKNSNIKEFKAVTTMAASRHDLIEQLVAVDLYNEWIAHTDTASIIDDNFEEGILTYSRLSVPWPFNDRDAITLLTLTENEHESLLELTLKPTASPKLDGIIRLTIGRGKWHLLEQPDNKTKVIYQFFADPGGSIPAWLLNMFIVDDPIKTLHNLRIRVE